MAEPKGIRTKRLRMRSWRRGTKEMDLILGPFSDSALSQLSEQELSDYEALLAQNDQDLYQWFAGRLQAPDNLSCLILKIQTFHGIG